MYTVASLPVFPGRDRPLRATGTCYMRAHGSRKTRKATRNNTAGRLSGGLLVLTYAIYDTYTLHVRGGATLTCSSWRTRDRVTLGEGHRSKERTRRGGGEKGSTKALSWSPTRARREEFWMQPRRRFVSWNTFFLSSSPRRRQDHSSKPPRFDIKRVLCRYCAYRTDEKVESGVVEGGRRCKIES